MPSRIVIVDTEELPRMELAIQLQEMGFKVEVAESGTEALEIFAESHPDLVITELLLGQLSGFEVSSRIAADPKLSCPVLFYTGFYRSESARNEIIKKYSAEGYFIKPFQLPQLKKAVTRIMKSKGDDHLGGVNKESAEARGDSALSTAQTPEVEKVGEPSPPTKMPTLFASIPGGEDGIKDATHDIQQSSLPLKVEPTIVRQVVAPWTMTKAKPGGTDAILRELASEAELDRPVGRSSQVSSESPWPGRSPKPSVTGLAEEPLPSFLSSAVRPARRHIFVPILLVLALVLIGLSFVYFHYRESLRPGPPVSVQSSAQQPASSLDLKGTTIDAQPNEQPLREGKLENPADTGQPQAELPPTSQAVELPPPSQAAVNKLIPEETGPPPAGTRTTPVETRDQDDTQHRQPSVLAVKVNEVSGQLGLPHLRRSPRLEISATAAMTVTKPLVVQFQISPVGKVVGSQIINESRENTALVPIVKATLSEWEFSSSGSAPGGTLVKYFSFRIVPAIEATAVSQ